MTNKQPTIVIVGGGFGGLAAAKSLRNSPVHVLLIDRTNHHLFQPLLYQVATSALAPNQIASPIRDILRAQPNTSVALAEVNGVDTEHNLVFANTSDRERVSIPYDYLILATGATHSYFGRDEFARNAPGLKTLADAVAIRNKILQAFEQAEAQEDATANRDLLTFVLVGAGPAGVEMAGAIAVLIRDTLRTQFRRIDPTSARVVLVDMANKVLGPYADDLSAAARQRLEKLGVEVRLGHGVDQIDESGVIVNGERIASRTVIWTAGVAPSPAGKWLKVETDRAGRVRIQPNLSVPAHPEIFVIGDTATLSVDGKPLAGVAQVAMQQGRYVGKLIHQRVTGKPEPAPFRYHDKGTMAVVGQGYAVLQTRKLHIKGSVAWFAWMGVHISFLAQPGLRLSVFLQWVWMFLTRQRGSRLIVEHHGFVPQTAAAEIHPPVETASNQAV